MDMHKVFPDLFEGHAPITLQNAFHEALEALEEWSEKAEEPLIPIHGVAMPISSVFVRMSDCTDLMPLRTQGVLEAIIGRDLVRASGRMLYADAARLAMPLCAARTDPDALPAYP
ncbi:hypothetical protein [Mesorhizobium captivum]|uniref:Uncharacterized protein n=2 Tax=Mesorhizobium captivum TaxID=3072319 RepID=A0ABU4ZA44_9HYPH|nr:MULTISPECIES: hypothetical protein [unclassified Mesorhizobium]MDX8496153.1 hypothetical protein [Mesorhizobium sp. VK22B]MDX8509411.1 hypothetical protein [Mesorhizobium sp. VK22E]MDX8515948.1 hypothetical protein [Mesorhizobium sp. VK23E]